MRSVLKNINNKSFLQIKEYLSNNNIYCESKISNSETFKSLTSITSSDQDDLTFILSNTSLEIIKKTKAKAALIDNKNIIHLPSSTFPIIVDDVYKAFAIISNLFQIQIISNGLISSNSKIHNTSNIEDNVQIDSFVEIKENCHIHKNVIIEANSTIGPNVTILNDTIIKSNNTLSNCHIGSNCIIKSGSVIGGVGFGFDPVSKIKIQHFGNVLIKNNCNIGSNTAIDRAVFDSTIISDNCFIDNLVQIAHNVIIGKGGIIAAQTGIAGSTVIGDNVMIGGQAGVSGHLKIGDNVIIAAKSGVTKNINDNSTVAGFPAVDIKKWKLQNIKFNRII